jgi:carboxymethylenebutenolidase
MKLLALLLLLPSAAILQAQDWARARLEASPRHHEYVPLKHDGRTVQAFVVYPEVKTKAPVIILIHEIFGLSDWAKSMADELAGAGYIVIAPDLLSGLGPNNGGTDAFPSQDAVTKAVSGLDPATVMADLDAAANYAKTIPAANGQLAVTGFCWGGGKSFAFATHRRDLSAAFVFYGPPPPAADMKNITAPVYGFYAGNDARIGATIPQAIIDMKAAGKRFEPLTYEGAGHGFMRAGEDPTNTVEANKKARTEGFARMTSVMNHLGAPGGASRNTTPTPNKSLAKKVSAPKPTQCHDPAMQMTGSM